MALKRQTDLMATFSMASMTDVIFLLLIFFMVTSTYVFPTALEVNLPQSTEQTSLKPGARVYINEAMELSAVTGDGEAEPMTLDQLPVWLRLTADQLPEGETLSVALYADESLPYGKVVEILNIGARADVKMVLATKPNASTATQPSEAQASEAQPQEPETV